MYASVSKRVVRIFLSHSSAPTLYAGRNNSSTYKGEEKNAREHRHSPWGHTVAHRLAFLT